MSLPAVARRACADQVLPGIDSSPVSRNDVIEGQIPVVKNATGQLETKAVCYGKICDDHAEPRIDDEYPVGATTVHLVCGILGTLFVGVFSADHSLGVQALGVLAYGAVCFPAALLIFFVLKVTVGIRVSKEEELKGLDLGEHGMEAYHGFQFFTNV